MGKVRIFKEKEPYLRNIILSFVFSSILGSYKQWINDGKNTIAKFYRDKQKVLFTMVLKKFNLNNYQKNNFLK